MQLDVRLFETLRRCDTDFDLPLCEPVMSDTEYS
jgi:hypothetical protein